MLPLHRKANLYRKESKTHYRSHAPGFALITSVLLVALIVLILVVLATFLSIEIRTSSNTLDRERAKQNALLGMQIAMGRIQELAGRDQRVTAPAGLLATVDAQNRHWIGVWDGDPTLSNPPALGWLVSGVSPNPATALGNPSINSEVVWMVKPEASAPESGVRVALEECSGGRFGYWVADESTKANVALQPIENPEFGRHEFGGDKAAAFWNYNDEDRFRTEVWKRVIPHRLRLDSLPEVAPEILLTSETEQRLRKSANSEAASIALKSRLPNSYLHDLTVYSRSVLTDVPWGRLKTDGNNVRKFANRIEKDINPGERNRRVDDFWDLEANAHPSSTTNLTMNEAKTGGPALDPKYQSAFRAPTDNTDDNGPVVMTNYAHAVMTEFNLRFSIYRQSGPDLQHVVLRWQMETEFWNPFNQYIIDESRMILRIRGLPKVTVQATDGQTFDVDLNKILVEEPVNDLNPGVGKPDEPDKPKEPHKFVYYQMQKPSTSDTWKPGEVKIFRTVGGEGKLVPKPSRNPKFKPSDDPKFYALARYLRPDVTGAFIEYVLPQKLAEGVGLTVSIPSFNSGRLPENDFPPFTPAMDFEDQRVKRQVEAYKKGDFLQLTLSDGFDYNQRDNPFSIHLPPITFSAATADNPSGTDPSWQFGFAYELRDNLAAMILTQNPHSRPYRPEMFEPISSSRWSPNPLNNTLSIPGGPSSNEYFYTNGPGFVLFEMAQDMPVSVGLRQHSLSDMCYAVGSPGHGSNWIFDTLFYSGRMIPRFGNPPRPASEFVGKTHGNPHLRLYHDPLNPLTENNHNTRTGANAPFGMTHPFQSARSLMLDGGFNINSLSVRAWEIMLSGINLPIDPARPSDTGWEAIDRVRRPLDRAFMRFPYSITNRGDFKTEDELRLLSGANLKEQAFLPQIRSLRPEEVRTLAERVVKATKTRGRPWRSVREFVDAGVLAGLLDPDGKDGDPSLKLEPVKSINEPFKDVKYSPIYLTQQDVLTTIAPFLNVRSDTFLIRAYGDHRNPLTGRVKARVMCEAVVQRIPTPYAQEVPLGEDDRIRLLHPAQHPFGRKFNLVSFRWLTPE